MQGLAEFNAATVELLSQRQRGGATIESPPCNRCPARAVCASARRSSRSCRAPKCFCRRRRGEPQEHLRRRRMRWAEYRYYDPKPSVLI